MGKADSDYTPEQQAIIQEMIEARAAADKARKAVDRVNAIRDGCLIPPPETKPTPKNGTPKEGPQDRRLTPIFNECWKPDGRPPTDLSDRALIKIVGDAFEKRYPGRTVDRKTILRKAGRLPR